MLNEHSVLSARREAEVPLIGPPFCFHHSDYWVCMVNNCRLLEYLAPLEAPMARTKQKPNKPQIHIMFDSNAIFNSSDMFLLPKRITDLILQNNNKHDVSVVWLLPEVVLMERQYQMKRNLRRLLSQAKKLEKRLEKKTILSEGLINKTIQSDTKKQCKTHGVSIVKCDYGRIDWQRVVNDAVNRNPPFEEISLEDDDNKKSEKGFRDAIIAETFIQYSEEFTPFTDKCKLILVTADNLLTKTVKDRTKALDFVSVFASDGDANNYINVTASHIEKEFISKILGFAGSAFTWKDTDSSKVKSSTVWESMRSKFAKQLNEVPFGADSRKNKTATLSKPQFNGKQNNRINIKSRLTIYSEATKSELRLPSSYSLYPSSAIMGAQPLSNSQSLGIIQPENSGTTLWAAEPLSMERVDALFAKGESIFDIYWSFHYSDNKEFNDVKVDDIRFVETSWKVESPLLRLVANPPYKL